MSATISKCGKYRFTLTRKTNVPLRWVKKCLFIMLNPSTADEKLDDPTIRRCISFAEREGCTELAVVNLYAYRATNPKELLALLKSDPVKAFGGLEQKQHLEEQIAIHSKLNHIIICGWGAQDGILAHGNRIIEMIEKHGAQAYCLGITKAGYPRHPLYVRGDKKLEPIVKIPGILDADPTPG